MSAVHINALCLQNYSQIFLSIFFFFFSGEPHLSSGGPAYKPKEDYYDEIIELKKVSFVTFSIRKIKHLLQKGLCSFDIM